MLVITIWINGEGYSFKATNIAFFESGDFQLILEDGTEKLFEKGSFTSFGGFAY